jgi:hypothetical protein
MIAYKRKRIQEFRNEMPVATIYFFVCSVYNPIQQNYEEESKANWEKCRDIS